MINSNKKIDISPESEELPKYQERFNHEMFYAIEILGKRLTETETERDRLQGRLKELESATVVDEKSGKRYLPVAVGGDVSSQNSGKTPKWAFATSAISLCAALFSLWIVTMREPAITVEQLAALNLPQFSQSIPMNSSWQPLQSGQMAEQLFLENNMDLLENQQELDVANLVEESKEIIPIEVAPVEVTSIETEMVAKTKETVDLPPVVAKSDKVKDVLAPVVTEKTVEATKKEPKAKEIAKTAKEVKQKPVVEKIIKPVIEPSLPHKGIARSVLPHTDLPDQLKDLEKRAFEGDGAAQHDLAALYASGTIVAVDFKRAAYWFYKAAENKIGNAHYNLGVMYHQGMGVEQDISAALAWYESAAGLEHPEALYNIGIAYIEGVGLDTDIKKGVAYLERASHYGVAQAAYNLGILHESSFLGGEDIAEALDWYRIAVSYGHEEAIASMDRLGARYADSGRHSINTPVSIANINVPNQEQLNNIEPAAGGINDKLIVQVQEYLVKESLLPQEANGIFDPKTEDAIRAYQKTAGLEVTGQPSQELLEFMKSK